jgi:hypothetical protein
MVIRGAIGILLLLLLIYGVIKAFPLLSGPAIRIENPVAYSAHPDGLVHIEGVAKHTETLTLDGGPLLIDESGHFATSLVLPHGGAILSLTATDRFGRSRLERRYVFVP